MAKRRKHRANSAGGTVSFHHGAARDLDLLLAKLRVDIAEVTANQADVARKAFRRFGRGRHVANLNFGDCFAYALAKETSATLLFKGHDFERTDVMVALY